MRGRLAKQWQFQGHLVESEVRAIILISLLLSLRELIGLKL